MHHFIDLDGHISKTFLREEIKQAEDDFRAWVRWVSMINYEEDILDDGEDALDVVGSKSNLRPIVPNMLVKRVQYPGIIRPVWDLFRVDDTQKH